MQAVEGPPASCPTFGRTGRRARLTIPNRLSQGGPFMCEESFMDLHDFAIGEESTGRVEPRPEKFRWCRTNRRQKVSSRRSRAQQTSSRGMHRRRRERLMW
jgi:hypothetical protein